MAKIVYSADSTCDLSRELIEKTGVSIIPLTVILGENSYHDGVDIFPEDIYSYVSKTGILPKTSAASQYEFSEQFKKLLSANPGCDILHFSLSDQLSCSYRNAAAAAEELSSEAGKIYVVDGRVLSTGTALLLLKAQDLENEGKTAEEIYQIITQMAQSGKGQTSFVVDSLDYLYKGGRCSGLTLMGARVLRIHPILIMADGYLKASAQKLRGSMASVVAKYIEYLRARHPNPDETRCFVTHTAMDPALVEIAKEKTKELFCFREIYETSAGSTINSHCGMGTLGLLFLDK